MIPWVEALYTLSMCFEYKKIDQTHTMLLWINSEMFCFLFWTSLWQQKHNSINWNWQFGNERNSESITQVPFTTATFQTCKPKTHLVIVVVFIARVPSFLTWWSTNLSSLTKPTSTQLGLTHWAGASDCSVFSWFRCGSSIKSLRWKGQCYRLVCRYACGNEMTHLIMV